MLQFDGDGGQYTSQDVMQEVIVTSQIRLDSFWERVGRFFDKKVFSFVWSTCGSFVCFDKGVKTVDVTRGDILNAGLAAATLGESAGAQIAARESTVTVGRWMSQAELKAMQATGRVQESFNVGITSVTLPPNAAAYGAAPAGDVFVQFGVPRSAIGASDGVWGKIFGPNSIFGPVRGITEMPPTTNIVVSP